MDVNPGVSQVRIMNEDGEPLQSGWYFSGIDGETIRHYVIEPTMTGSSLMLHELEEGDSLVLVDAPLHWVADALDIDVFGLDERQIARLCVKRISELRGNGMRG